MACWLLFVPALLLHLIHAVFPLAMHFQQSAELKDLEVETEKSILLGHAGACLWLPRLITDPSPECVTHYNCWLPDLGVGRVVASPSRCRRSITARRSKYGMLALVPPEIILYHMQFCLP